MTKKKYRDAGTGKYVKKATLKITKKQQFLRRRRSGKGSERNNKQCVLVTAFSPKLADGEVDEKQ